MKEQILSFKETQQLKKIFPEKSLSQIMSISKTTTAEEITQCSQLFPNASNNDLEVIIKGRNFIRWYAKNGLYVSMLVGILPRLICKLVPSGPWYRFLDTYPLIDQSFEVVAEGKAIPCALTDQPATSILAGKGVILLHILIIGFLSLVVSTFLKFTGRGDLIPLITFVGGAIILYECIGLFWGIYEAIAYILNA